MAAVNKLVFSILKFLEEQKLSGQLDDEAQESLEVAIQCLEQVYKLNTSEDEIVRKYSVPQKLQDLFSAHLKETESNISSLSLHEATAQEKEEAERLKSKGNDFMKAERYADALESYSQAIRLDSKNAVYFCNRAAACSKLDKHQQAIEDCHKALSIDPSHSKAYGRMGIAYTALEKHEDAFQCYQKALELDPGNQSYKNNLEIAAQKLKDNVMRTDFSAGVGGSFSSQGAPGNFDFGRLFSDPGVLNMAATIMSNPQMQDMISNVMSGGSAGGAGFSNIFQATQQMASQMQQTNPDLIQQLMSQLQQQARNNGSGQSNDQGSGPQSQQ